MRPIEYLKILSHWKLFHSNGVETVFFFFFFEGGRYWTEEHANAPRLTNKFNHSNLHPASKTGILINKLSFVVLYINE